MISDKLIYPVADMLNLSMHEMKDGRIRGAGSRMLHVGGMKFDAEIVAVSHVVLAAQASYFVRVYGPIWMYVVVTSIGNDPDMWVAVFDGRVFDLKVKDAASFGEKTISATVEKLSKGTTRVLQFKAKQNSWKIDAPDLVEAVEAQDA